MGETKKISVGGAVKSFISQMRVGQDLTKISMPAAFCYPYSGLELSAYRNLRCADILYSLHEEKSAFNRIKIVLFWYLSQVENEEFEKKPYNPILRETHCAYVESD